MRAVVVEQWGGPENLVEREMERPVPGLGEVLVRVHAAGVNPVDWKTRAGGALIEWGTVPAVGWDVSGTVEAVGPGVGIFRPGDEVFGMPLFPKQAGGYAEYVVAPARHLAPKPASLTHVEAAALPLAALTAWQALVDTADVRPGERVLVHAAAGGVGHLAVQIAKARGAYVIGTASAGKHQLVRELGADEVVDYRETRFEDVVSDVDVVLDGIGGETAARSLKVLRDGGRLITLPGPDDVPAAPDEVRAVWVLVEPDHLGLREIAALVEQGKLRPVVEVAVPLAEAAKAHEIGEQGRTTGKIVLTVA
ncbi:MULTISPECIES: NADP-dependent oxidoreductase [Streptomyces]|uniref:Zinc-containing alcohol dehydrogenase quinone oxidoreductase n=1 Tax=Streptomyces venezuelae (strain ATCC 10712 / CBS 650.69 / DSM 40230 / JCM 4526 / NBRC 13096 / PD 04745) TaxID=953739 RepID=F2R4D0_STRVP|nr:NADP-dependent oxidoreductase [Streptomyces venezuelae]APE19630.1 NADPH:quinone reductase [Streptomyces venezuelae]QER97046.1 NADP-dependent oxidoreductase [Streptomyces venezuelae ATCC 10712]QES04232.1 NADP-dependent oxidoreductase [Streptomyces venezuelae]CCA53407.1 zinc-containing alcohol dehydrogenase; quinone oxidoreductase [Streptomyces venezuelae ATCC 10712]